MPSATDTLSTLLQVLDRADLKQADAQATEERDRLVRLAQELGTAHPPAVLADAATEVLDGTPAPVSVVSRPEGSAFRWGWKRPTTPEACARRLSWRQQLARYRPHGVGVPWFAGGLIGVAVLAFHLGVIIPHAGPKALFHTDPVAAGVVLAVMIPVLTGLITLLISTTGLFETVDAWKRPEELEPDDLPHRMGDYLAHAECRSYLRQVLQSSLPVLLGGDVTRLEDLRHRLDHQAYVAELAKEQKQRAIAAAQRAQERAAQRPAYLAQLAQALDQHNAAPGTD